ncbi:glutaminase [Rheinheimera riviphila]|uniref:Glutaminase n=1 Tax=Rheinheimera riviphila TaxID=1834037 RepID=A0A437QM46_9GAMM|nr:glutaminase [Rheinheimera riviphila]RVU35520.1 glutaminase [Rheinheimera riviphila]
MSQNFCAIDNLQGRLQTLLRDARQEQHDGKVANYIPALAEVPADKLAIAVATLDGNICAAGDSTEPFSIQSLSKMYALVMAMQLQGDALWQRVRMEPSGQPFNSIVQLEWERGIPRNPVINAGAIVVSDVLTSHYSASKNTFLMFIRRLAQTEQIFANAKVYASEQQHGSRNAALAYLMKSFDNIKSDVPAVLAQYFHQCSVEMSCQQLARSWLFLANRGVDPVTDQQICSRKDAQRVNAILSTSGMYDQSGEFAFTVGLPAKSGVGGGIVAIVPNYGVIASWSPPLNSFGNSCLSMYLIHRLAEELGLSVY